MVWTTGRNVCGFITVLWRRSVLGDCQRSTIYLAKALGMHDFVARLKADGTPGWDASFEHDVEQFPLPFQAIATIRSPAAVDDAAPISADAAASATAQTIVNEHDD